MEAVGEEKKWKMPTLISYLNRLTEKGFIRSEKKGRDRWYYPIIDEKEYLESYLKTYALGNYDEDKNYNINREYIMSFAKKAIQNDFK